MKPLVEFIAVAHNEYEWNTPFFNAMLAQTDSNWKATVWHNGYNMYMRSWVELLKDDRLIYRQSSVDSGNWGCANRQTAIDECKTEYIIQSSVQDYWLPQAVEYINKILTEQQPDILLWDSINHVVGPCLKLDGQLAWSKCDWGQFALRTSIAKQVGIKRGDVYCGDWAFVQDVLSSGLVDMNKIIKLPAIITCHN